MKRKYILEISVETLEAKAEQFLAPLKKKVFEIIPR
jgi:hypothetical protein